LAAPRVVKYKLPMARVALVTILAAACGAAEAAPSEAPVAGERVAVIVATGEVHGTPEPCGCTSDPLGDVSRVVTLARGGLLVDAGGLRYDPEDRAPEKKRERDAKAALLGQVYAQAQARTADSAPKVLQAGGVAVGVFTAKDVKQARAGVAKVRGAEVVVALLDVTRAQARAILQDVPGIHFGVIGRDVGDGMAEPEPVGGGFLVAPADQARYVARIEAHLLGGDTKSGGDTKRGADAKGGGDARGPVKLVPFAGEAARKLALDRIARKLATLDAQLAAWQHDPTADRAFVAAREEERKQLAAEKTRLESTPPAPPTTSYFTYALTPVRHIIARDPSVAAALKQLARTIGAENLRAARDTPPPPAEPDQPRYVGAAACAKCHKPAVEFWSHTVHAQAWKTLVDVDKQYHYDCIGCHVTGFQKPGGAALATVEKQHLVDVQCEVCHGPGSKHVADAGLDDPKTLVARPPDRFCAENCHTKEHSDTFQLEAYLRDVVGHGHGEKLRARLGDGPTGHELRQKALAAAGRN
jgi:Cytochrome c554 and c-prime